MSFGPQNRVTNIVEVRDLALVENNWIFDLTTVANDNIIPYDDIPP